MRTRTRAAAAALTCTALLVGTTAAVATVVDPGTPRTGTLVQVGPVAETGFPTWYRDSRGLRLEPCWQSGDPYCAPLPDTYPDPDAPTSYPGNFPEESFYQLAGATVAAGTAGTVDVGMDLEGAFVNGVVAAGDQMVFGRIRIRARTAPAGQYRVVHPYGVDEFSVTTGGINMTQDIGATPGAFGQALQGRVGPFLTWDTFTPGDPTPGGPGEPPAGYVGDPAVLHKVTGSPYGTNVVRVERKAADGSWAVLGTTDQFTLQGRLASQHGVDVQQGTYRRTADGGTLVELFATSTSGASIAVRAPGLGVRKLTMEGDPVVMTPGQEAGTGRYFARIAVPAGTAVTGGGDATTLTVENAGDPSPQATTVRLQDVVTITGATHVGNQVVVTATSGDPTAVLTAKGLGQLVDGRLVLDDVQAPPPVVTVTSSEGGSASVSTTTSGAPTPLDPPVAAAAVSPLRPLVGRAVTLDATGTQDAVAYDWSTVSTPAGASVDLADTVSSTFTPTVPGDYLFELVAVGASGVRSAPLPVTVAVAEAAVPPAARAAAGPVVRRGATATLDGSASTGALSYAWRQLPPAADRPLTPATTVALTGATTARPSFLLPVMPLPAAPGPNAGYTALTTEPLRFELTVTGEDGSTSTATTTVTPAAESVTGVTARYRTRTRDWRISGTTDLRAGQRVSFVLGSKLDAAGKPDVTSARGAVVGSATVDGVGAFTFAAAGPDPTATRPVTTTLTVVSALGGQAVVPVEVIR